MPKRFCLGIALVLCLSLLLPAQSKREKTYELIYKDVQLLKKQFLELSEKVTRNNADIRDVKQQIDEILDLSRQLQAEQRKLQGDQARFPAQFQVILEKLETVSGYLSTLTEDMIELKSLALRPVQPSEGVEGTDPEAKPPDAVEKKAGETQEMESEETPPPSAKPNLSPREIYNMAHSDYLKGSYSLAIDGFKIYLEQFKDSPYADNALYWIGECYFAQREFETAIEYFKRLILEYPQGDKVPAAYLKRGISLMELGKNDEALSVFTLLTSKFPMEEETRIAQDKIREIRKDERR